MTIRSGSNKFFQEVKNRRTIYSISKEVTVSDERIQEIVSQAVKHTPSAFNSQTARVVVLFGEAHNKLWDITASTLRKLTTADFTATEQKLNGFRNGYGTILFFEDQAVVTSLQANFPLYKDHFPLWSLQSSGMLQIVIWTALEAEGLGANLQHYNPVIDDEVKKTWDIPEEWLLLAQMPFGKKTAPAGEKEFQPLESRVRFVK